MDLIPLAQRYSMVDESKLNNFLKQLDYVCSKNIEGAIVECGVWKGGSICMAASYLKRKGVKKHVYAFDSFEGLPKPTDVDYVIETGILAKDICGVPEDTNNNCFSSVETFYETMDKFELSRDEIQIKKGWFETTTQDFPESIALLRFDGDWYKSTMDVLTNLFDKVSDGGVLIFDDYTYWNGNKKAVDDFLERIHLKPTLQFVDPGEAWFIKNFV
jgi:O-methyltransferase